MASIARDPEVNPVFQLKHGHQKSELIPPIATKIWSCMSKIYVHDFFPIHTQALADAVARLFAGTEIVPLVKLATIKDGDAQNGPDYLLVNADSYIHPGKVTALELVLQRLKNVHVIVLSNHTRNFLTNVLQLKDQDQLIKAGVSWLEFSRTIRTIIEPSSASDIEKPEELIKLTKRQKQILILSHQGKNNREVAEVLNVSEHTVKVHAWRLYRRLNVNNRLEALAKARRMGVL